MKVPIQNKAWGPALLVKKNLHVLKQKISQLFIA